MVGMDDGAHREADDSLSGDWRIDDLKLLDEFGEPIKSKGEEIPVHDLALGVLVPLGVEVRVSRSDSPFSVTMKLFNELDGVVVQRLQVEAETAGASLTSTDLRAIAVDRIVYKTQVWAFQSARLKYKWHRTMTADPHSLSPSERLQRAATTYRLATIMRRNATEDVAAYLQVSRATAGRLIRRCREAGLLPPAKKERR